MAVSRDEFFREVTLRICSSLQINTAFGRVFEYLREHFPMDHMFLDITDKNLGVIRHIAVATIGTKTPEEIITIPAGLWEWVRKLQSPFILTPSDPDDRIRAFAPLIKLEGHSDLALPLRIEAELIGFLVLRTRGEGKFTPEHVELLATVAEPFAIALANVLAHEQVIKYRDILIDDNRFLNREILSLVGDDIVGGNSGLRNVMEMVRQVAPLSNTVLLWGKREQGRKLLPTRYILHRPARMDHLSRSTAEPSRKALLTTNCSATKRAPSPGRLRKNGGASNVPRGGQFSSTRSANCPPRRRCGFSGCFKTGKLSVLEEASLSPLISG